MTDPEAPLEFRYLPLWAGLGALVVILWLLFGDFQ